jgi:hypothetical protein
MAAIAFGALQPWVEVTPAGRLVMLVILLPLGFLWFYTDWAERAGRKERRAAAAGPTGEQVGKSAGRLAGAAYVAGRKAVKKRSET